MKSARNSIAVLVAGTAMLMLAACTTVAPSPLDPKATAAALTARNLDDATVHSALDREHLASADGQPWSLDALTVAAWVLRPDVRAAAADVQAAAAAVRTAREIPNPSLTIDPGYLYDNANNNVSPWTVATALGFTIELGGKRRIRTAQAEFDREARNWQYAETLWKVRAEVRKALIARQLAQTAVHLADEEVSFRTSFRDWVENEFRFGAAAQPDRLAAATNLAQAQGTLRTARGDLTNVQSELAAALGVSTPKLPQERIAALPLDDLPQLGENEALDLRDAAILNRVSVRQALAAYNSSEQALQLAVAKQYPDVAFGPGYSYDKGDRGITLNLGFTLPLFHGSAAAIAEAMAAREKAADAFQVEQAQALSALETSVASYGAARAALADARTGEQAAQGTAEAAQRRLDRGLADRGDIVAAQLARIVAERATLDAQRAALQALGAVEDSIQRPYWPKSALSNQIASSAAP